MYCLAYFFVSSNSIMLEEDAIKYSYDAARAAISISLVDNCDSIYDDTSCFVVASLVVVGSSTLDDGNEDVDVDDDESVLVPDESDH